MKIKPTPLTDRFKAALYNHPSASFVHYLSRGQEKIVFNGINYIKYFYPENINLFMLLACVKKDAKNFLLSNPAFSGIRPSFFKFNRPPDYHKYKGVEIDISAAYWDTARKLFLSEKTYLLGLNLKQERLIALGSLAKKERVIIVQNGKIVKDGIERLDTEPIYLEICYEIDSILQALLIQPSSLGYWVDNFFFSDPENFENITQYIQAFGYKTKDKIVEFSFRILNNCLYLQVDSKKMYFMYKLDDIL